MKRKVITKHQTLLADSTTPVSIYLKLRDLYSGSVLLESSDFHHLENCFSYIGLEPIADFMADEEQILTRYDGEQGQARSLNSFEAIPQSLRRFMDSFEFIENDGHPNGFFGYMSFESVRFFEKLPESRQKPGEMVPSVRYHLYRYVISINHFNDQLTITENLLPGRESHLEEVVFQIKNRPIVNYPFHTPGYEEANMEDEDYKGLVSRAKEHCQRGDVFQLVLSRRFTRGFKGDEFNVYRALRSINPSPYLFYFEFGDYRIMGSSPEMQIKTQGRQATINPIAGTFRRTGNDQEDKKLAAQLIEDEKENSEHVMLVDLARNDLSKSTSEVQVIKNREIQFYSHVLHIVSTVSGKMDDARDGVQVLADTFPAGTLSGAPKIRAMELIDRYEPEKRNFYGGCIGHIGIDGSINHAITIRSFLSRGNVLHYQAGAGITNQSVEENELAEVDNKLQALRDAIEQAQIINM